MRRSVRYAVTARLAREEKGESAGGYADLRTRIASCYEFIGVGRLDENVVTTVRLAKVNKLELETCLWAHLDHVQLHHASTESSRDDGSTPTAPRGICERGAQ